MAITTDELRAANFVETSPGCFAKVGTGAVREFWSDSDVKILRDYYAQTPAKEFSLVTLATRLRRTFAAVACKADDLKLCKPRTAPKEFSESGLKNMSLAQRKRYAADPEIAARLREGYFRRLQQKGHPRGFLGHKRTKEEVAKMVAGSKRAHDDPTHVVNSKQYRLKKAYASSRAQGWRTAAGTYSFAKHGWRTVGGKSFYARSQWEANYARYLEWLKCRGEILDWAHEPKTFWFAEIQRGCRSYKPDFRVEIQRSEPDLIGEPRIEYHEVKGWMTSRSRTALNRMRIYHPTIKVVLVDAKRYRQIAKVAKHIVPEWESELLSKSTGKVPF